MNPIESDMIVEKGYQGTPFVVERQLNLIHLPIPEQTLRAQSHFQDGIQYRRRGLPTKARECFADAVSLVSSNIEYLLALAQTEYDLGRLEESASYFRKLTHLQPENPSFWLTLGFINVQLENYASSIAPLSAAIALDSKSPDALFLLAESLRKTGHYEKSLPFYEKLLPIGTERPHAVYGYALSLFALDRLETAWEAFEFRRVCHLGTWEERLLLDWTGICSPEKKVLVYSEEGLASDVMYASCLNNMIDSVGQCTVQCHPSLHSLFARSFPKADFVESAQPFEAQSTVFSIFDDSLQPELEAKPVWEQVAFGSLPRFFRKNNDDFPRDKAYLFADNNLQKKWALYLRQKNSLPKAGILWEGNWCSESQVQRTIPGDLLQTLLVLGKQNGLDWTCLQQGSQRSKLSDIRSLTGVDIHDVQNQLNPGDIENWAALISALDLVVTPPGFVAHLAGALGVRTLIVLPTPCDWRWMIRGGLPKHRTPWYSNAVLCAQERNSSWGEALGRMTSEINQLHKEKKADNV